MYQVLGEDMKWCALGMGAGRALLSGSSDWATCTAVQREDEKRITMLTL
jgi:hypothetical protein